MKSDSSTTLISIIIPVYNVSQYLEKCVSSICTKDVAAEIILIDDGSTDGSSIICDELGKNNNSIRVIHKDNEGVGCARNVGIKHANGEWIVFIDADDYLTHDAIAEIASSINNEVDLIVHGWNHIENGQMVSSVHCPEDGTLSITEVCKKDFFYGYVWAYAFRKSIIIENTIFFSTKIKYAEDWDFIARYYSIIRNRIVILPGCLYNHVRRIGSATQQELGVKYIKDNFIMFRNVLEASRDNPELRRMLVRNLHLLIKWFVNNVIYCSADKKELQRIYRKERNTLAKTNLSFALHPIVLMPGFVNRQRYYYFCRIYFCFSKTWSTFVCK